MHPTHAPRACPASPGHSPPPQRSTLGVSQAGHADEVCFDGVLVAVASGVHQAGRVVASEDGAVLDAGLRAWDAGTWLAVAMGCNHAGPFVLESSAAACVFLLMTFLVDCFLPVAFFVAFFRTVLDTGRRTLEGATSHDSLCCRGRPGLAHCTIWRPRGNG